MGVLAFPAPEDTPALPSSIAWRDGKHAP